MAVRNLNVNPNENGPQFRLFKRIGGQIAANINRNNYSAVEETGRIYAQNEDRFLRSVAEVLNVPVNDPDNQDFLDLVTRHVDQTPYDATQALQMWKAFATNDPMFEFNGAQRIRLRNVINRYKQVATRTEAEVARLTPQAIEDELYSNFDIVFKRETRNRIFGSALFAIPIFNVDQINQAGEQAIQFKVEFQQQMEQKYGAYHFEDVVVYVYRTKRLAGVAYRPSLLDHTRPIARSQKLYNDYDIQHFFDTFVTEAENSLNLRKDDARYEDMGFDDTMYVLHGSLWEALQELYGRNDNEAAEDKILTFVIKLDFSVDNIEPEYVLANRGRHLRADEEYLLPAVRELPEPARRRVIDAIDVAENRYLARWRRQPEGQPDQGTLRRTTRINYKRYHTTGQKQ